MLRLGKGNVHGINLQNDPTLPYASVSTSRAWRREILQRLVESYYRVSLRPGRYTYFGYKHDNKVYLL